MKAILEFSLPEEEQAHQDAINGAAWHIVVWEVDALLRSLCKHGHTYKTVDEALQAVRERLHREITERGLTLC